MFYRSITTVRNHFASRNVAVVPMLLLFLLLLLLLLLLMLLLLLPLLLSLRVAVVAAPPASPFGGDLRFCRRLQFSSSSHSATDSRLVSVVSLVLVVSVGPRWSRRVRTAKGKERKDRSTVVIPRAPNPKSRSPV